MKSKKDIYKLIKENLPSFKSFKHVYIFGSTLNPHIPSNDIDILVIYTKYSKKMQDDLIYFSEIIEKTSGIIVDLTALSVEEEKEVSFLNRIKPNYMKLK